MKTTAAKIVKVGFDAKTTFAQARKPIQKSDIKVGDRIVIHAVQVNEKLVAHTVEWGGEHSQALEISRNLRRAPIERLLAKSTGHFAFDLWS